MKAVKTSLIVAIALVLSGCTGNLVYDKNLSMPEKEWHWKQRGQFDIQVEDTASTYDLYVNTRINRNYPFSNMWVLIQEVTPANDTDLIRMELPLFAPDGQALGVSKGIVWEYRIPIIKGKTFSKNGNYQYSIEQNMRISSLPGVLDIGIALEKTGEKF